MKKIITLTIFLLVTHLLFGQKIKPFIVKGQIKNCPEKQLIIWFGDKIGISPFDTIKLDDKGFFYLKTFKVKEPEGASIQRNRVQINNIFVAPGYNLIINGDAKDLLKTTTIQGVGAKCNKYKIILDSKIDTTRWFELKDNELLSYIHSKRKLKDSIANLVFSKTNSDKYSNYFKRMVYLDNLFMELYSLVAHVNNGNYNYEKSISFIRDNFDNNILDNISKDGYLISGDYKICIAEYLNYLIRLDYLNNETLRKYTDYKLEKANNTYTGKVKEYVLYHHISSSIKGANSLNDLNEYKKLYNPYITSFKNPVYNNYINDIFREREAELIRTSIGRPAPLFTLKSNKGLLYNLKDFKGKVVYLDLWASWCGPCRAETPFLKILYNKYKNDNRIVFISIAVSDGSKEWEKALEQDNPEWLQLLDDDGTVNRSYVANIIPQFVIIDKQGNIVDFYAPRPSSDGLESILAAEMSK